MVSGWRFPGMRLTCSHDRYRPTASIGELEPGSVKHGTSATAGYPSRGGETKEPIGAQPDQDRDREIGQQARRHDQPGVTSATGTLKRKPSDTAAARTHVVGLDSGVR
jgi:hypothetical protein